MKRAVCLVLVLAGCSAPAGDPTSPDAPIQPAEPLVLKTQTLERDGDCSGMHQSPQGAHTIGIGRLARPEALHHVRIEVQWDAVVSPGAIVGASIDRPDARPIPDMAWAVDRDNKPLVLEIDNATWPMRAEGLITMFVEGEVAVAEVPVADDVAFVATCQFLATITIVTIATDDG